MEGGGLRRTATVNTLETASHSPVAANEELHTAIVSCVNSCLMPGVGFSVSGVGLRVQGR